MHALLQTVCVDRPCLKQHKCDLGQQIKDNFSVADCKYGSALRLVGRRAVRFTLDGNNAIASLTTKLKMKQTFIAHIGLTCDIENCERCLEGDYSTNNQQREQLTSIERPGNLSPRANFYGQKQRVCAACWQADRPSLPTVLPCCRWPSKC